MAQSRKRAEGLKVTSSRCAWKVMIVYAKEHGT